MTSRPAFVQAMAMPPPIVPAPMMPTRRTGAPLTSFGRSGILLTARSAKKTWMSALAGSVRTTSRNSAVSRAQPSANGSTVASSMASMALSGAGCCGFTLRARVRAASNSGAFVSAVPSLSARSLVFGCGPPFSTTRSANRIAPSSRSPSITSSTNPWASASAAVIGFDVTTMLSAFSTPTSRGRRCVPSAPGMMPSAHSGRPSFAPAAPTR
jgi:hypothetical protein